MTLNFNTIAAGVFAALVVGFGIAAGQALFDYSYRRYQASRLPVTVAGS